MKVVLDRGEDVFENFVEFRRSVIDVVAYNIFVKICKARADPIELSPIPKNHPCIRPRSEHPVTCLPNLGIAIVQITGNLFGSSDPGVIIDACFLARKGKDRFSGLDVYDNKVPSALTRFRPVLGRNDELRHPKVDR